MHNNNSYQFNHVDPLGCIYVCMYVNIYKLLISQYCNYISCKETYTKNSFIPLSFFLHCMANPIVPDMRDVNIYSFRLWFIIQK